MGVALAALLIDNLSKINAGMAGLKNIDYVLRKLAWMRSQRIWPNGLRYLWTDAFGLVLLVSLYEALNEEPYLDGAKELVARSTACLGESAAFVSGKSPTAMGSISTISPCGFMLSVCWGALLAMNALAIGFSWTGADPDEAAGQPQRPIVFELRGFLWQSL